ncbi:hypothetical protein NMY22_g2503 [Coprinellus aureogranulatus]|nr:hypothetical protein NMY22_g2503 [Coprinellus aureogranulatus]
MHLPGIKFNALVAFTPSGKDKGVEASAKLADPIDLIIVSLYEKYNMCGGPRISYLAKDSQPKQLTIEGGLSLLGLHFEETTIHYGQRSANSQQSCLKVDVELKCDVVKGGSVPVQLEVFKVNDRTHIHLNGIPLSEILDAINDLMLFNKIRELTRADPCKEIDIPLKDIFHMSFWPKIEFAEKQPKQVQGQPRRCAFEVSFTWTVKCALTKEKVTELEIELFPPSDPLVINIPKQWQDLWGEIRTALANAVDRIAKHLLENVDKFSEILVFIAARYYTQKWMQQVIRAWLCRHSDAKVPKPIPEPVPVSTITSKQTDDGKQVSLNEEFQKIIQKVRTDSPITIGCLEDILAMLGEEDPTKIRPPLPQIPCPDDKKPIFIKNIKRLIEKFKEIRDRDWNKTTWEQDYKLVTNPLGPESDLDLWTSLHEVQIHFGLYVGAYQPVGQGIFFQRNESTWPKNGEPDPRPEVEIFHRIDNLTGGTNFSSLTYEANKIRRSLMSWWQWLWDFYSRSGPSRSTWNCRQWRHAFGLPDDPATSVLESKDILPIILEHLKDVEGPEWRAAFAQVIRTNGSFFDCGTKVLWGEMKSLTPFLQLLPWFNHNYRGLAMYEYAGAEDWKRFSVYARKVNHLSVYDPAGEVAIAEEWMSQLMNLHGRPDPLFPVLQRVELRNIDKPYHNHLFLTLNEQLSYLDARARQDPSVLLASSPMLSHKCSNLTYFAYSGPTSPELFHNVSRIKTLTHAWVEMTSTCHQRDIISLRSLPNLQTLALHLEKNREIVYDSNLPVATAVKTLESLTVVASSNTQLAIQRALLPSPCYLDLTISRRGARLVEIYSTLRHCFNFSSRLITMDIGFSTRINVDEFPVDSRAAAATKQALLEGGRVLQQLNLVNVPPSVGEPFSLMLQTAIPRWTSLQKLLFHVRTGQYPIKQFGRPYPNITFLATIQQACPCMEEFEFHFDDDVSAFEGHANQAASAHPLRILRVNTTRRDISLGVGEISRIAMYLDQLFPSLEEVSGTANALWRDVDVANVLAYDEYVYKQRLPVNCSGVLRKGLNSSSSSSSSTSSEIVLAALAESRTGMFNRRVWWHGWSRTCHVRIGVHQLQASSLVSLNLDPNLHTTHQRSKIAYLIRPLTATGAGSPASIAEDRRHLLQSSVTARDDVLTSMDILPLIFSHLKEQLQDEQDKSKPEDRDIAMYFVTGNSRWRSSFRPVIFTSRSFFEAGIATLWHTVESFEACLRLLPWCQRWYKGLGAYEYSGMKDWERFSFYAGHIRRMKLEMVPGEDVLSELRSLHGRPDPLFPTLKSVDLSCGFSLPGPTLLLFVIGEPLRKLNFRVSFPFDNQEVLSALTTIHQRSTHLANFEYTGKSSPGLFQHIARTASLTDVFLYLSSDATPNDISLLRLLPNLQKLGLIMNSGRIMLDHDWSIPANHKPLLGFAVVGPTSTHLSCVRVIAPFAYYIHVTVPPPSWENMLVLMVHWLAISDHTISIRLSSNDWYASEPSFVPSAGAAHTRRTLLTTGHSLREFIMENVPARIGEPLSLHLQSHVLQWKYLQKLSYAIRPADGLTGLYGRPYPNLSFLASIQERCPDLEELEFHFDDDACACTVGMPPSAVNISNPSSHPLRILRVNTIRQVYDYSAQEKGEIASYLRSLFPRLTEVSGSARELWQDVDSLIHTYQTL